ncbi:MAG: hypothetical protein AB1757_29965 [Acidobacteriota bacterium]
MKTRSKPKPKRMVASDPIADSITASPANSIPSAVAGSETVASDTALYRELYFTIWKAEHDHTKTRWTVTTFFIGISFALFGVSIRGEKSIVPFWVGIIAALVIYWFAFVVFLRFNEYTRLMRAYLRQLEDSGKIALSFQSQTDEKMRGKRKWLRSASTLLFTFGVLYTALGLVVGYWFRG